MRVLKLVAIACFITMPLAAQDAVIEDGSPSPSRRTAGRRQRARGEHEHGCRYRCQWDLPLTVGAAAVRGQQVVLTARYIGHKPMTRTVTLGRRRTATGLHPRARPAAARRSRRDGRRGSDRSDENSGSPSGSVTEEQMKPVPAPTRWKVCKARSRACGFVPQSAQPGSEPAIRLRGATSISGRQDPLYIVDGVIARYGIADISPAGRGADRSGQGAAASSLYGSNGANGVVQVFTKRGTTRCRKAPCRSRSARRRA